MSTPTLPLELFAIIIDHLDARTLIRCREVCKILRNLIDNSPSFQYKIELAVAGMDDGLPSDLRPVERLRMLNAHQTAWKQLSWKELHVPILAELEPDELWACSGGVMAMGHHPMHETVNSVELLITLVQLPSVLRGIEEKTWRIVIKTNRRIRKFEIDPSQDLIVLLSMARHGDAHVYCYVHLHMLSTGEPHPLSAGVLTHRGDILFRRSYRIQIIDDMVGVQCTTSNHLTIWDWKTGELRMGMKERCFSFLTKDLVVTSVTTGLALNIYDLRLSSNEEGIPTKVPLLCTFEFPPLSEQTASETFLMDTITDLSSGKPSRYTLSAPFRTSHNDRLYAFRCCTTYRNPLTLMVFAPLSTFMVHIDGLRAGETGRSFSWEEWGEKHARILELDEPLLEVRCVHGMKFSIVNDNQIDVYDFNRLSFRRDLLSGTANRPPLSIITDSIFMQPVYSSLPYQVRSAPMPSSQHGRPTAVITEDCLMPLLEWHELPDGFLVFNF